MMITGNKVKTNKGCMVYNWMISMSYHHFRGRFPQTFSSRQGKAGLRRIAAMGDRGFFGSKFKERNDGRAFITEKGKRIMETETTKFNYDITGIMQLMNNLSNNGEVFCRIIL